MPRGANTFHQHKAAIEQRRADAQAQFGSKADFFKLDAGQYAAVRFLEQGQEIAWASVHRVPVAGRQYPQDFVCLDQGDDGTPCPYCQSAHAGIRTRATKGFYNLIWRGGPAFNAINQQILAQNSQLIAAGQPPSPVYTLAPVYKRNEFKTPEKGADGKPIILGYADGIFLWKASKTVHDLIVAKDGSYHGLSSRDFVVRREGSTKEDTHYYIEPLDVNAGPQPMSPEDQLLAAQKYNLDEFITPSSYEQAVQVLAGVAPASGPQPTFERGGPAMPPAPGALQQVQPNPALPNPFGYPAPGGTFVR